MNVEEVGYWNEGQPLICDHYPFYSGLRKWERIVDRYRISKRDKKRTNWRNSYEDIAEFLNGMSTEIFETALMLGALGALLWKDPPLYYLFINAERSSSICKNFFLFIPLDGFEVWSWKLRSMKEFGWISFEWTLFSTGYLIKDLFIIMTKWHNFRIGLKFQLIQKKPSVLNTSFHFLVRKSY